MAQWTPKQNALLIERFTANVSIAQITAELNQRFRITRSEGGVAFQGFTLGLRRPGPRPVVQWSDEQNDELRHRVANKELYAEIAIEMGVNFSALRTQIGRLGIARPSRAATQQEPRTALDRLYAQTQASLDKALKVRLNRLVRMRRLMNVVPDEYIIPDPRPIRPDPVSDPHNLTLAEINRGQCHWIANDDVTEPRYCGHPTGANTQSWCPAHHHVTTA